MAQLAHEFVSQWMYELAQPHISYIVGVGIESDRPISLLISVSALFVVVGMTGAQQRQH